MERIASFCVDHTKLDRGMYLSRQDGDVLTWDIRMKKPNQGDYLTTAAALVVEEAGLNSHAAIAGKALLKPTIVGAAGACSHIRDGLDIAVDCAHGSVQRLQA